MDINIEEVYKRNENGRPVTRGVYVKSMTMLRNRLGELLFDESKVVEVICSMYPNLQTQKILFVSLIVFLKHLTEEERPQNHTDLLSTLTKKMNEVSNIIKNRYEAQEKSEVEVEKWIEWPEVVEIWQNMEPPTFTKFFDAKSLYKAQEYCIIGLYVTIPPLRNDYRTLFITSIPGANYISFEENGDVTMTFNHYKTSGTYGTNVVTLSREENEKLSSALRQLYECRKSLGCKTLFANKTGRGQPFTSSAFSQCVSSFFREKVGKDVSSQILRKSFLSYLQKDDPLFVEKKNAALQRQNVARTMGHSLHMQEMYRRVG